MAVTVQKVGGYLCGNFALKCMLDMKKVGNGLFDWSQNMGPNCGIFWELFGQYGYCYRLLWVLL